MSKKYRDEEWLIENYRLTSKNKCELADECGLSWNHTIGRWLDRYDIVKIHRDEEWLRKKYVDEGLSGVEIARDHVPYEIGSGAVQRQIRELGLKRPYQKESVLREKYCGTENSISDMAEEFGVTVGTIHSNMKKHDIDRVDIEDRYDVYGNPLEGVTGEDHPLYDPDRINQDWRHSSEWREIRKMAKDRDDNECQLCGSEDELNVHHITPVYDGGAKFDPHNLVTLCWPCHMGPDGVHSNRRNSHRNPGVSWVTEETSIYT